jgi:hypothetical protein
MHEFCVEAEAERVCNPLLFGFDQQMRASREITAKLFRTSLDNAIHYRAFLDYENLVVLQHLNGAEIGEHLHSRNTSTKMCEIMHESFRSQYTTKLKTVVPAFNALPHIGIAADKVSDKLFKQWQITTGGIQHAL